MSGRGHVWTVGQVHFAAKLWRQNRSADDIADVMAEVFGLILTKNSIISLSKRHRDLMPPRTAAQLGESYARAALLRKERAA